MNAQDKVRLYIDAKREVRRFVLNMPLVKEAPLAIRYPEFESVISKVIEDLISEGVLERL